MFCMRVYACGICCETFFLRFFIKYTNKHVRVGLIFPLVFLSLFLSFGSFHENQGNLYAKTSFSSFRKLCNCEWTRHFHLISSSLPCVQYEANQAEAKWSEVKRSEPTIKASIWIYRCIKCVLLKCVFNINFRYNLILYQSHHRRTRIRFRSAEKFHFIIAEFHSFGESGENLFEISIFVVFNIIGSWPFQVIRDEIDEPTTKANMWLAITSCLTH